jgi:hypothetical protein
MARKDREPPPHAEVYGNDEEREHAQLRKELREELRRTQRAEESHRARRQEIERLRLF